MNTVGALSGRGIGKWYRATEPVLKGVDIEIRPGHITALIGPSGAGKTTLIRALSFLDPPNEGEILLDGIAHNFPHASHDRFAPWPSLTVVFQQLFLWPHLSLLQNITLPLINKHDGKRNGEMLAELIDQFEMQEFIHRYPNQVSLGQRQRAALARALVLEPRYILFDEITSALDVEQVASLLGYLEILRERNIGVLLVTHLLNFARRAADHIVFLDNGRTIESGSPTILDNPVSERLKKFLSAVQAAT
jgi:ABC-type polar amino acid transport system ATPase subunit